MTPEQPPLDLALLNENAEIGMEELHDLIDMYLAQADETVVGLQTAIRSGAADKVDHLAHKLAGSSAVCGVTVMMAPLRALEQRGRDKQLAGADQLLADIAERLELSRRLLAEYLDDAERKS